MAGILYIVATPIGNLNDITLRALETFKSVDLILCEDTRVTKNLLDHFNISKPLLSYHHHSPETRIKEIKNLLAEGKNLALVTDAGTPGISDPGNLLISRIVRSNEIESPLGRGRGGLDAIVPIPGPSALISALSISGFPTDKFLFLGFPPHKNKRKKFFAEVSNSECTTVFYESGHRILKCLGELKEILNPERKVVVCRELTKKFETIYRGTISEVVEQMKDERGEFVAIVEGKR